MLREILFTEKYRPKNLDDIILPASLIEEFKRGQFQNMIFTGSPGTGKTSVVKAIVNHFEFDSLYINASSETSVDVVRTQITDFCSTVSIFDGDRKMKIVILDEVDGASDQFFKALRATIEKFEKTSRFFLTCNYLSKIPEPVQDRFKIINFDFDKASEKELLIAALKRLKKITVAEGINIEDKALIKLVQKKFPSLRSILNTLQGFKLEQKPNVTVEDIDKFHGVFKDVFDFMFTSIDPIKNYQFLITNYGNRVDEILDALSFDLIEYIEAEKPEKISKIPEIIIKNAKYQATRKDVINPAISMLACFYDLQVTIQS